MFVNLKFFGILGLLFMSFVITPELAQAGEATTYRLDNGLTVVLQDDKRFPLVSMRLYVHAGSAYENPKEMGISHLLEHMVFQGTEKRGNGDIAKDIEALGGYLNAATSFDYTVYLTDLPAEHWRTGLDVLKDMAFHASIDEDALKSEKKVVIAELKRGEDNPSNRLFQMLQASALKDTAYEHPIIGYEDVINDISRQDIIDYITKHYQPQSMLLLIVGDLDEKNLRPEIERLYGGIKNSCGYNMPESVDLRTLHKDAPFIKVEKGKWNKVYFSLAFPTIGQRDARTVQLDVLSSLLGGGKTSYLYRKYKYDLQLVDSISFSNYSFERLGLVYLSAVLDEEKFQTFWSELSKDLASINDIKFSDDELERVKLNAENDLYRAKETLSGLSSKLGYFSFFDQGIQGEKNYLYALRQTSLEDLQGQLQSTITLNNMSLAVLAPENSGKHLTEANIKKILNKNWPGSGNKKPEKISSKTAGSSEVINLGQGRTLILQADNTLPYISGSLMFSGGDALLEKDVQGLASLTASVLTKGTADLNATEIEDYLANRASSLVASAGRQSFSFNFTCPERFSSDIFKLLQDTITRPAFRAEEWNRSKQNQIAAIRASEDQPLGMAFRHMFPFLFEDHSYGFMQLGTTDNVAKLKIEQAMAYWNIQQDFPWVLSICGTFDREAVIKAAKNIPAPKQDAPFMLSTPQWGQKHELQLNLPGRNQSHILLIFPTAQLGNPDAPALNLLQSVLSGMSGMLFTELRDKQGLGYTVTAIPWVSQKAGMLIFYIGTEPEKVEQAKQGFFDVINTVTSEKLSDEVLNRGKNSIKGDYYRSMQSLGARSGEAATLFTLGMPLDTSKKDLDKVSKISPEELQRVASKYLDLNKAYWVEVHP